MKAIYTTYFFLICYWVGFAQTQEFAPIGATWTHQVPAFIGPPGSVDIAVFTVTGIDTIQGKACKRLEGEFPCAGDPVEHIYQEGQKIYRYLDDQFLLLYDFAALPGESWTVHTDPQFALEDSIIVIVDSLSQKIVSGHVLNIQHVTLDQGDTPYWDWANEISREVGMLGMIFPGYGPCDPMSAGLRCYETDSLLYNFSGIPCDSTWLISSTNSVLTAADVQVYPNPVEDQLNIEFYNNNNFTIRVFDQLGKLHSIEKSNNISTKKWPKGVYYLQILLEDSSSISKKIIKL